MTGEAWAQKIFKKAVERFPFGQPPEVEEVARVALFLASDQSAQITGQTISVNGGLSFGGW
jgi:3-oxoacyl-[acyl-carrier protein] reductase